MEPHRYTPGAMVGPMSNSMIPIVSPTVFEGRILIPYALQNKTGKRASHSILYADTMVEIIEDDVSIYKDRQDCAHGCIYT